MEPIILDSAHRHGVSDAAMLHALRFPVRHFVRDDAMTMFIGPDEAGTLVEVGVIALLRRHVALRGDAYGS